MEPSLAVLYKLTVKITNVAGVDCGFPFNSGFISPAKIAQNAPPDDRIGLSDDSQFFATATNGLPDPYP